MVREVKSANHLQKIEKSDNKSKAVWSIVNHKRKSKKEEVAEIVIEGNEGKLISAPTDVCNAFSEFFSNVGRTSTNSPIRRRTVNGTNNRLLNSLFLGPTTEEEVKNVIKDLKNKKSSGSDELSPFLLKKVSSNLLQPLCHLINYSFVCGQFPKSLKTSVVRPIFKKGDAKMCNSYRPISLISTFSKIFEKVMLIRLWRFLEQHDIILKNQHGFVKGKSTTTAMFNFINEVVRELDSRNYSTGVLFFLSKAFDMVDHELLLMKMSEVGVRGIALDWFASYLRDRKQFVEIRAVDEAGCVRPYASDETSIVRGVPQGSVLGPVLFLLYINTLSSCTSSAKISLFADDTSLSISNPNLHLLERISFSEANKLIQWFHENSLIVNSEKTQLINFCLTNRRANSFSLLLEETEVHPAHSVKFLGLVLDENLGFRSHIEHVSKKLSSGIFVLRGLRNVTNVDVLLAAYYGIIYPHLAYAVPIWGNECRNTQFLFRLQRWAVRTIFSLRRDQCCKQYFRESKILTFPSIFILETLTFVKQNFSKFDFSIKTPYSLRDSNRLLTIPKHSTTFFKKHLQYNGIKLFNSLPISLKLEPDLLKFRRILKTRLIDLSCYSVQEFMTLV